VTIAFYCFATLTVLSALVLLWTRQLLYSAFALLFTFLGIAGLYVLAGADFVAIVQIMIYVGGVLVLLIFGIMLTDRRAGEATPVLGSINRWTGILAAGGLFAIFFIVFLKSNLQFMAPPVSDAQPSSIRAIGIGLMTDYLLPFETAAVLLMVALMGAAYIAGKRS
jgi:NADH-quinone oxidoreductase subunit J